MKKRGTALSSIRTCSRDAAREIRRNPVPATLSLRAPDASCVIRRSPVSATTLATFGGGASRRVEPAPTEEDEGKAILGFDGPCVVPVGDW